MRVPSALGDSDETHTARYQAPGKQTCLAEGIAAVHISYFRVLNSDIEGLLRIGGRNQLVSIAKICIHRLHIVVAPRQRIQGFQQRAAAVKPLPRNSVRKAE